MPLILGRVISPFIRTHRGAGRQQGNLFHCHSASQPRRNVLPMAKNKGVRLVITLECTECRSNPAKRSPGVSRYTTMKNRRNTTERLELKKFCKHCNSSTVHKEIK